MESVIDCMSDKIIIVSGSDDSDGDSDTGDKNIISDTDSDTSGTENSGVKKCMLLCFQSV